MNWQAAAESARGDLFEFAFRILGYEKLLPGIHREWSLTCPRRLSQLS